MILKHWMTHNNRELAELLDVSVSSISYAKKDICSDLIKSLGGTLISLIRNEQFEEINQRLILEYDYLHYETVLSSSLIKRINSLYNSELHKNENWREKENIANKMLVNALSNETSMKSKETTQILQFLQHHFTPNTTDLIEYFDIYQLKQLVDILQGKHGTSEMRYNLIRYLRDSPSEWERAIREEANFQFLEDLDISR